MPNVSLPVLPTDQPLKLAPTDITQFVRHEQCERYLRFRISESAKIKFMEEYEVAPQRISPLLTLSGAEFEKGIEELSRHQSRCINYDTLAHQDRGRPQNNQELIDVIRRLVPGEKVLFFQTRLAVDLAGWQLRGDIDLLRVERREDGELHLLVGDMKSTIEVKVEHRLQVAFYRRMLEQLFREHQIPHASIELGILLRPPADPTPQDEIDLQPLRSAAKNLFGFEGVLVEVVADTEAYLRSVDDLVLNPHSTARRVIAEPFERIPYSLTYKCDDCLYNEFCMKWSAETEDLSLLPYMTGIDKEALHQVGITTIQSLATLKNLVAKPGETKLSELVPAAGLEAQIKQIGASWSVGSRLDELILRARSYRRFTRHDAIDTLSFIPGKGHSTLPVSTPDLNPNLIRLYLDAQQDYLEGRVYLLSALVVACDRGEPVARRSIVQITDGPPDTLAAEKKLFVEWTRALAQAVVDLAVSDGEVGAKKSAPIHIIFFNAREQKVLLEGLARNFPPILHETPPLYDFLTQIAAFDSPIATFLDEELRTFKNLPMTCQTLQSVARFMKFDWKSPLLFDEIFKARLFDHAGKLELDGNSEWYTRRARFGSSLPLEYAYAVWNQLPPSRPKKGDEFAAFRKVTRDDFVAFQQRRLEAIEHVTQSVRGNDKTEITSFVLPDLVDFQDKANNLAQALNEFVTIERLVELNDWKGVRHIAPERRVLLGDCLLARYREEDQESGISEQNRDNEQRRLLKEEWQKNNPGKRISPKENVDMKWSNEGLRIKLTIETTGVDCDLHELLLLTNLREGDSLILMPRLTVDERLTVAEQKEFTPTPKQVLYGLRAMLVGIRALEKDGQGRILRAVAEIELKGMFGNKSMQPFVFSSVESTLRHGQLYTIDSCPDNIYGYWCNKVVEGLCAGEPHVLYDRLIAPTSPQIDTAGDEGQRTFLAGLDAFRAAGHFHNFEPSKRELIGTHASTPLLIVQGPPGTGKSYSTAFAIFARVQGAMRSNLPCRVFLSCKTHAATDVLLKNVVEVRLKLQQFHDADPQLFVQYFDPRLLELPLYRIAGKEQQPEGIISLPKEAKNYKLIEQSSWTVVGVTPGGIYSLTKDSGKKSLFGNQLCDLLVLDEASQMNIPEGIMAALLLKPEATVIVVGDHRQMPPIVKHDWDSETRRTFHQYQVYESLFDALRAKKVPMIQFAESFRLHSSMAEFLRQEVYCHDGIDYHSRKQKLLSAQACSDPFVEAVLNPEYPLIVVVHEEEESQVRNVFEEGLISPILRTLADKSLYGLEGSEGLGIVVPHRAQRAAMQQAFPELSIIDPRSGLATRSAIDTVERFQGDERTVILVSATESDPAYLLASSAFLLDPRRLTVAISRAKCKMILVASSRIFSLFTPDEETFTNSLLWKNLLYRTCSQQLWEGEHEGTAVSVWGGK